MDLVVQSSKNWQEYIGAFAYLTPSNFSELIESGADAGSSLVVYQNGKKVFDLVGGYADLRFQVPWNPNTLGPFFGGTVLTTAFVFSLLQQKYLLKRDLIFSESS